MLRVRLFNESFCPGINPVPLNQNFWHIRLFKKPPVNPSVGFRGGSDSKKSSCNAEDLGLIPGLGRSLGGGQGNPLQRSCLENPHGQRNLAGYSPWGCKESDVTKRLSTAEVCGQKQDRQCPGAPSPAGTCRPCHPGAAVPGAGPSPGPAQVFLPLSSCTSLSSCPPPRADGTLLSL